MHAHLHTWYASSCTVPHCASMHLPQNGPAHAPCHQHPARRLPERWVPLRQGRYRHSGRVRRGVSLPELLRRMVLEIIVLHAAQSRQHLQQDPWAVHQRIDSGQRQGPPPACRDFPTRGHSRIRWWQGQEASKQTQGLKVQVAPCLPHLYRILLLHWSSAPCHPSFPWRSTVATSSTPVTCIL